jgi:hypothetical protein
MGREGSTVNTHGAPNNALTITANYPEDKFTLLVPIKTVAQIASIQRPVMNVVTISTDLNDKEIYVQEKAVEAWKEKDGKGKEHPAKPARYALTKKGLTKLMNASGIKVLSSESVIPSTCQKCASVNSRIGKPVNCGACPNKDIKYTVRILIPQLTGESIEVISSKEINIEDAPAGMSEKEKAQFMKFRAEHCESKALNRALRTAMQIKSTYLIEEFKKPFVVAYLVPNLDHPDVKSAAIQHMMSSAGNLYGGAINCASPSNVIHIDDDEGPSPSYGIPPDEDPEYADIPSEPPDDLHCHDCGVEINKNVSDYSKRNFNIPLCRICQNDRRKSK